MNPIPLSTAKAIVQSFMDAVNNIDYSEQRFNDEYRAENYRESIRRTCTLRYDGRKRHKISRFCVEERSIYRGTVMRVVLDDVQDMSIDETETFLIVDAMPYKLCIAIEKEEDA